MLIFNNINDLSDQSFAEYRVSLHRIAETIRHKFSAEHFNTTITDSSAKDVITGLCFSFITSIKTSFTPFFTLFNRPLRHFRINWLPFIKHNCTFGTLHLSIIYAHYINFKWRIVYIYYPGEVPNKKIKITLASLLLSHPFSALKIGFERPLFSLFPLPAFYSSYWFIVLNPLVMKRPWWSTIDGVL